jgi:hypothetical protein
MNLDATRHPFHRAHLVTGPAPDACYHLVEDVTITGGRRFCLMSERAHAWPGLPMPVQQEGPLDPGKVRVERVLARAYRGIHHVTGWERRQHHGQGISVTVLHGVSTFDYDVLTRLVVAAHDEAVRIEVCPGGPGKLKLLLHPREREGGFTERHDQIDVAVEKARLW